jgi:hypothetical protein
MNNPASPAEFHPDLTDARLGQIAQVIRDEIVRAYAKFKGEKKVGWSRGCTVYEGVKNATEVMAASVPWLKYKQEKGQAYSLQIGEVAIRVQRFDDEPKPAMDGEVAQKKTVGTQVPLFSGMATLEHCLVRMEFEMVGEDVYCHLRVWSRDEIPVLYHGWELGKTESGATFNVSALVKAVAAKQAPASFVVDGEEAEHDNAGSDVG